MITELDASGGAWHAMTEQQRERIRDWLREQGEDPERIFSVRLVGEGCIEVERFVRRNDGSLILHPMIPNHPWTERETVMASRIPQEWP